MNMKIKKNWDNIAIAKILSDVSAAYEVKGGNTFKVAAYDRAAAAIEHATSEIKDLWDEGKLEEIPGVGESISSHLDLLFRKGDVPHFRKVMKGLPPAMFELLDIQGIGPKTALKLCQALKINNPTNAILTLKKAALKGKIREIEGFAEQSEKDILEGIGRVNRAEKRMILPFAWELAEKVIDYMISGKVGIRIDHLGSLRRMAATVGDIDLAIATDEPEKAIKWFLDFPEAEEKIISGANTARIIHRSGRQIDLKTMAPEAYGALLQHFTGSKQHNIHLREIAQKKGMSLSEYGVKPRFSGQKGSGKIKKYASEEAFYKAIGMEWIPPELREDTGEIEAALRQAQGKPSGLPKLVELSDIKGDLHLHSSFPIEESHDPGQDSPQDMLEAAEKMGYEYIGLSEHNPSQSQHTSEDIYSLLKKKKDMIEELNSSRTNKLLKHVFNGLEIDIKPNGELAIPSQGINLLDYVIVSVHSNFQISREKMTKRILRALSYPKVKIFGHPTGRKLNYREGYELNWEAIFDYCKKRNIWLEINSWPDRLDLPDSLVREAVENGVKIIICTDSHAADQLNLMKWGVSVARRGWAEKSDIINTLTYDKIYQEMKGGEN